MRFFLVEVVVVGLLLVVVEGVKQGRKNRRRVSMVMVVVMVMGVVEMWKRWFLKMVKNVEMECGLWK